MAEESRRLIADAPEQKVETALSASFEYTDEQKEKDAASFVAARYKDWSDARQHFEDKWETYYKNYRQMLPEGHKWRSRVFDPTTFQNVESLVPRIMGALFPEPNFFEAQARDPQQIGAEESIHALLMAQWNKAEGYNKMVDIIKQALIYGTTFAKIPFREEYAKKRDKVVEFEESVDPITGVNKRKPSKVFTEEKKVRTYYGPDVEVVDIFDIFTDPFDQSLDEVIHITRRNIQYCRDRAEEGVWRNVEKLVGKRTRGTGDQDSTDSGQFRWDEQQISGHGDDDEVIIKEFWGMYDIDGSGEPEPVVITIADDAVVLSIEPNPYWHGRPPFVYSQFIPVPKEVYGIGIAESVESLQKQVNDIINQRNDNVSLILNRMWLVSSLVDVDLKRLTSAPGRFIVTSDINGVKPLDTPDVTSSSYNEAGLLKQQAEEATGFSRFAAGLEQGRTTPRAARTVLAFQQASLEKFGMTVKLLEKNLVEPILKMFVMLNQQFLDDFEYIRVTKNEKPEVLTVDPNSLRGGYAIKMLGASEMMNREQKLQGLLTFLATVQQDPSIDRGPIIDKIWRLLGNREDLPRIQQQPEPVEGAETIQGQLQNSGVLQPPTQPIPGGGL